MSQHDNDVANYDSDHYADDDGLEESECDYRVGGYHRVQLGEVFASRWRIDKKLGWGHFSTVWLATDLLNARHGALKVQKSAENYLEAAEDEREILQKIARTEDRAVTGHGKRFLVQLLDSFFHEGPHGRHPVMVFEVLGDNLLTLLDAYEGKFRGLPLALVQEITWQVCAGLAFLHEQCQVLHCDLKLENVLISGMSMQLARRLVGKPRRRGDEERGHFGMQNVDMLQILLEESTTTTTALMEEEEEEEGKEWTTVGGAPGGMNARPSEVFFSEQDLAKREDLFWGQNFVYKWQQSGSSSADAHRPSLSQMTILAWIPLEIVAKQCTSLGNHTYQFAATTTLELIPARLQHQGACIGEDAVNRLVKFGQLQQLSNPGSSLAYHPTASTGGNGERRSAQLWRITVLDDEASLEQLESSFQILLLFARFPLSTGGVRCIGVSARGGGGVKLDRDVAIKPLSQRRCLHNLRASPQYIGRAPISTISIKICDLGNACWRDKHFSDTIQTRQYRAPEVILRPDSYDVGADAWSLACLAFELYTGEFLFQPENSHEEGKGFSRDEDHLALIAELLGSHPPLAMRRTCGLYSKRTGALKRIPNITCKSLKQVLRDEFKHLGDKSNKRISSFLLELLKWDPAQRMTMAQALKHPFLRDYVVLE